MYNITGTKQDNDLWFFFDSDPWSCMTVLISWQAYCIWKCASKYVLHLLYIILSLVIDIPAYIHTFAVISIHKLYKKTPPPRHLLGQSYQVSTAWPRRSYSAAEVAVKWSNDSSSHKSSHISIPDQPHLRLSIISPNIRQMCTCESIQLLRGGYVSFSWKTV